VAFFVGGEGEIRTFEKHFAVREGEKSTARGARKREIFRVAATWVLPTEIRRARERKTLSCNGAHDQICFPTPP